MENMITSNGLVSVGQINGFADVIANATRKSTLKKLNAFNEAGHLNSANMQIMLAGGGKITSPIAEIVEKKLQEMLTGVVGCLKLISPGKRLVIGATKGDETSTSANDTFACVRPLLKKWGCDQVERPTPEVLAEAYELIEDASYSRIFGGFGQNFDQLCFTTPQINNFLLNHAHNYLDEEKGLTYIIFLLKIGNAFFIVYVRLWPLVGELFVAGVDRMFKNIDVRDAKHRHIIVVPCPTLAS
jgi:hypothetical protein